jgi:hypothetical protein
VKVQFHENTVNLYIFTNQKLIVKHFKKYHEVPYKDFSTILLNEHRKSDRITIVLKIDSLVNLDIIQIPYAQKNSDLYNKIISNKKTFT